MIEVEAILTLDGVATEVLVEGRPIPKDPPLAQGPLDGSLPGEGGYAEDIKVTNYAGVDVTDLLTEEQLDDCSELLVEALEE
jgi:hypothetical protein